MVCRLNMRPPCITIILWTPVFSVQKSLKYTESGFDLRFSNSLIIHHCKTKIIINLKEVWIPGLNWHRFWRFYFSVYSLLLFFSIEKIYQTCFIGYPNTSSFVKNTPLRVVLSTLFGCLDIPIKDCLSCLIYYLKQIALTKHRHR